MVEEVNFASYCQQQHIQPLKQPQVVLQPQHKKAHFQPELQAPSLISNNSLEMFDEQDAKAELFRFGQRNLPKEMRFGKYKFSSTLDLHNYTKAHALDILERFIANAPPAACLKIIHGQGTNSEYNQPVLLGAIRKFLEYLPQVVAYTYGSPPQGGGGVTLVKLKS
jgi:DNA-nicking Smr family endonuclease